MSGTAAASNVFGVALADPTTVIERLNQNAPKQLRAPSRASDSADAIRVHSRSLKPRTVAGSETRVLRVVTEGSHASTLTYPSLKDVLDALGALWVYARHLENPQQEAR